MERTTLVSALRRVQPAISVKPRVPVLGSVFFDGGHITAYDGELGIVTPCVFPLVGGVDGKLLTAWAAGCSGDDIDVGETPNEARFRCSRSYITLPIVEASQLIYTQPEGFGVEVREVSALFTDIARSLPFMGNDDAHGWAQGTTLAVDGFDSTIYATDSTTLFHSATGVEADGKAVVVLPPRFVKILISLAKNSAVEALEIGPGWVTASFDDGTQLFARTNGEASPARFDVVFDELIEGVEEFPVPEGFSKAISNVAQVIHGLGDSALQDCCLRIRDNVMEIVTSEGGRAAARESLDFEHPDILVWVPAKELLRASTDASTLAIGDAACLFWNSNAVSVVSCAT